MKKYLFLLVVCLILPLLSMCQNKIKGNEKKVKCIETFIGHNSEVFSASFSPDGTKIVSTSDDETIKIWDVKTGKCLKNFPHAHYKASISASFSPDGKKIVSCGGDNFIKIWDVNSGSCIKSINANYTCLIFVAFSPNGKNIISYVENDKFWNIWDANTGQSIYSYTVGHNIIYSTLYNSLGNKIIQLLNGRTINIYDNTKNEIQFLKSFEENDTELTSTSYSPDGTKILAPTKEGFIKILDANNGKCIQTLYGHNGIVISASFNSDGSRVVSTAINDRNIKIWDTNTGECLQTLYGHDETIYSVKISPNDNYIVSTSRDGTIKLWGVAE